MPKIAMIGAGSIVFTKTLVMDILATEALAGSEICLMSRTQPKLDRMEAFVKRVIKDNKLPATVWSTLDRAEALKGADYVICMIKVGGADAFKGRCNVTYMCRRDGTGYGGPIGDGTEHEPQDRGDSQHGEEFSAVTSWRRQRVEGRVARIQRMTQQVPTRPSGKRQRRGVGLHA